MDESKSMFIANISHELRTPLALILGLTEKLLQSDEAQTWTEDITRSLHIITDNANILLKVIYIANFWLNSDRSRNAKLINEFFASST